MDNNEATNKIFGLYPGILKAEDVEKLSEIDVWKKIDSLGGILFWLSHDRGKPYFNNVTVSQEEELNYTLQYLVYHTRNFGVEFSQEPTLGKHVESSPSYQVWFRFWKNHFDSMDAELYKEFVSVKEKGLDISKYMPQDKWQDHYQKVATKQKSDDLKNSVS